MLLAHWPWSGHYQVREALWGYAHYGQFAEAGWQYLNGGCMDLAGGGSVVTLKSPGDDFSIILETKDANAPQELTFDLNGLPAKDLCVWRSNAREQFVQQPSLQPTNGSFTITVDPDSIYSISTTTGQQKGSFDDIPAPASFPFPYEELFDTYTPAKAYGHLPRYTADIAGAFELVGRPEGGRGMCLRQVVPVRTISWAPDWLPYTILGDEKWTNYDVSAEVYLNPGDTAGVMGRVNHVGTGYGIVPKGYYATLGADGQCQLVVVRGKKDKKQLIGDAEQQTMIKAAKDAGEGGEKVLATARVPGVKAQEWYQLKLRFSGQSVSVLIDGQPVLTVTDATYARGMAGLLAGADGQRLSTPFFDDLCISAVNAPAVKPYEALPNQRPLYGQAK
jgi:galactosylceramidase